MPPLNSDPKAVYTVLETPIGSIRLSATEDGLCKIALGDETRESFEGWLVQNVGQFIHDPKMTILARAGEQLQSYLAGSSDEFDVSLDLRGTPFQMDVWQTVSRIPYGETATYGRIASELGRPKAARAVGAANGANPLPIVVPCHRVVGSDGSLCGYGGGLPIKQSLLELEGTG